MNPQPNHSTSFRAALWILTTMLQQSRNSTTTQSQTSHKQHCISAAMHQHIQGRHQHSRVKHELRLSISLSLGILKDTFLSLCLQNTTPLGGVVFLVTSEMLFFVFLQSYSFHTFHSYTFGILIPCIHEYSFRNTQNKHTCNSTELHVCAKKEKSTFRYSKRKKVTITSTPPQPITTQATPQLNITISGSAQLQIYTILSTNLYHSQHSNMYTFRYTYNYHYTE